MPKKFNQKEYNKEWRARHPGYSNEWSKKHPPTKEQKKKRREYCKEWNLINKYGITRSAFESMLLGQGGVCAICKTDKWGDRRPAIDHDHRTGEIRGILCFRCNLALGLLDDEPGRVMAAFEYLQRDWKDEAGVNDDENDREA